MGTYHKSSMGDERVEAGTPCYQAELSISQAQVGSLSKRPMDVWSIRWPLMWPEASNPPQMIIFTVHNIDHGILVSLATGPIYKYSNHHTCQMWGVSVSFLQPFLFLSFQEACIVQSSKAVNCSQHVAHGGKFPFNPVLIRCCCCAAPKCQAAHTPQDKGYRTWIITKALT